MVRPKSKSLVGTTVGIYDVLECVEEDSIDNGFTGKYKVKCRKCGKESIIRKIQLYRAKRGDVEGCSLCNRGRPSIKYKPGMKIGKYEILERLEGGKKVIVKCLKCGWTGEIALNMISNKRHVKSTKDVCMHGMDKKQFAFKLGEEVEGRYKILGFIHVNGKMKRTRYIAKCMFCNTILELSQSNIIYNTSKEGSCRHKALFDPEKYKKGDYFYEEKALRDDFVARDFTKEEVKYGTSTIDSKEDKKENMDKFISYVLDKNETTIHEAIIDVITKDKDFINGLTQNARSYLAFKLNTADEEDNLDEIIATALRSKEFKIALISKGNNVSSVNETTKPIDPVSKPRRANPVKTGFKINEVANFSLDNGDDEFDDFIKILKMYKIAPGNRNKDIFSKSEISKMIKGNVPRIIEKSVNVGLFTYAGVSNKNQMYSINNDKLNELYSK